MTFRNTIYATLGLSALLCAGMTAIPRPVQGDRLPNFCGTPNPSPAEIQRIEYLTQKQLTGKGSLRAGSASLSGLTDAPNAPINVDVYFHIITRADGTTGNLSDDQIKALLDVLNDGFAGKYQLPNGVTPLGTAAASPFRFVLKGIDRTANDLWYGDGDTYAMKSTLRKGGAGALNVYMCSIIPIGLVGYATFPSWYKFDPLSDGVVYDNTALPGGSGSYNAGRVLAHEVGHWAGLYHTFQDGCTKYNDFVNDTAAEAAPFRGDWFAGGFPGTQPDSCASRFFPGKDPVDNQMDYSADTSRVRFTPGQVARMIAYCRVYRNLK